MAKQAPAPSSLTGFWKIISLASEENEVLNEEEQAFIEFDEEGAGAFQLGSIKGCMDRYRTKTRQGKRVAQFCWDGKDEADGTYLDGIGWVVHDGKKLTGTISINMRDDHEFVAERSEGKRAPERQ